MPERFIAFTLGELELYFAQGSGQKNVIFGRQLNPLKGVLYSPADSRTMSVALF